MKGDRHADHLDAVVAEILERFGIDVPVGRAWRGTLRDLRHVLGADYEARVAAHFASCELPVDELVRAAREHFPSFNDAPLSFAEALEHARDRQRGLGLDVRMSAYGRPGNPLRGFYHHVGMRRPLIWLNRQHPETAVGATFAHELGHHFWEHIGAAGPTTRVLHHDGFVAHLDDPRELFADAFTAVGGYPRAMARRLFGRRRWGAPCSSTAQRAGDQVERVERYVHSHYPGDLGPTSGLRHGRRLYYLGSLVHFSKLRAAILRVVGI